MHKFVVPVSGMHCKSCEVLIESELEKIIDINNQTPNHNKSEVIIFSDVKTLDLDKIRKILEKNNYRIGQSSLPWVQTSGSYFKDFFIALSIFIVLYFLARLFGLDKLNFANINNPSNLLVVLLIGLTAGVSSCMALVGGLVLAISARFSEIHPQAKASQKFRPHLFFNLGRIAGFFVLGGLIGLIGSAIKPSSLTLGVMTIIIGLVMLILGLQLTELFPRFAKFKITLPKFITKVLGIADKSKNEYSHTNSFVLGALTFFLPCGFTQAMQLFAASSGNFLEGGIIMAIFALGTTPGLLGIGWLSSVVKGGFGRIFFKLVGILVVVLAIFNLNNGLNLAGLNFEIKKPANTSQTIDETNIKIENGVQIVKMDQLSNGYKPNHFTVKKGLLVKWIINSLNPNSCAASIIVPKLKIEKFLNAGENVVEFTPTETGRINFSCGMGMYRGYFEVVDANGQASNFSQNDDTSDLPRSCCSGQNN
ncbi:MAG: sulfite exporter TauE/SafE family protein [Patescibacteria group bacterium]|nr:sulfite exporter TauE/SafE family protein [Patescibacteria group bacterium]